LQDADDWSTEDRLELQLDAAERSGAELLGCQEIRVGYGADGAKAVCYPLDASEALRLDIDCAVLHPTSLVSRAFVQRVGGFVSGFRFGGDFEFQARARYVAGRAINIGHYGYFRRWRQGSLSASAETGLQSEARLRQDTMVIARAEENQAGVANGRPPN